MDFLYIFYGDCRLVKCHSQQKGSSRPDPRGLRRCNRPKQGLYCASAQLGTEKMQSEDRIIHFGVELIHRPVQTKVQTLQKLYFDLSQIRGAGYDSTDFTNPMQARFYSRRGSKTQSLALFLPDREVMVEEWADIPLSNFLDKVREMARLALPARGVERLMVHTATIRSTFALTHYDDARVFLLDHACRQEDRIAPHFRRPVAVGGLRFVLPETNEDPGNLHVTVESFRHSLKEVFVEVKGVFGRRPVGLEDVDVILGNIGAVRSFVSERVYPYLEQYDHPQGLDL